MARLNLRDALAGREVKHKKASIDAWYDSLSYKKYTNSLKATNKFYDYGKRSGWTIKNEPPFHASSLIRREEIRVIHYILEYLDYEGIKKRFAEAHGEQI